MFIKTIINYVNSRLYTKDTVILFNLQNHKNQSSVASIKHATDKNIFDILHFQNTKYIDVFKKFLSLGDKGYLGYLKGVCIHRSWVKENMQVINLHWASRYKLKRNEIIIHYCETAPEARGKNIYGHVLSTIIEEHKNKNILISINEKNKISIKVAQKVGFRETEREKILVIMGIKFIKKTIKNDLK